MLAPAPVGEAPMSAIDVRVCASSASNTVCLFQTLPTPTCDFEDVFEIAP
jgi:hypothetical protein